MDLVPMVVSPAYLLEGLSTTLQPTRKTGTSVATA